MKNYLLILSLLLFGIGLQSQTAKAFNYQAVVRDANGQLLSNQPVGLQINLIVEDGRNTTTVFTENHSPTTNAFGLVNLEIGRGIVEFGQFETLNWSQAMFISIGLDASGGRNYQNMGTAELLSVPYALYAASGGTTELPKDPQLGDIAYYDGTSWQRLPAGGPRAVLTMGKDGIPTWRNPRLDFLLEVALPNGDTIYAHPRDNNNGNKVEWGGLGTDINGLPNISTGTEAFLDFDGEGNTEKIVAQLGDNNGTIYAAKICDNLVAFGFDDWYLPAAGELEALYQELKLKGSGEFADDFYHSSTENDKSTAWGNQFANFLLSLSQKNHLNLLRCVRK